MQAGGVRGPGLGGIAPVPWRVHETNLCQRGDVTPFGQVLSICCIREVWDWLKAEIDLDG